MKYSFERVRVDGSFLNTSVFEVPVKARMVIEGTAAGWRLSRARIVRRPNTGAEPVHDVAEFTAYSGAIRITREGDACRYEMTCYRRHGAPLARVACFADLLLTALEGTTREDWEVRQ